MAFLIFGFAMLFLGRCNLYNTQIPLDFFTIRTASYLPLRDMRHL
jgi:hypothetical protein